MSKWAHDVVILSNSNLSAVAEAFLSRQLCTSHSIVYRAPVALMRARLADRASPEVI
jgi:hypothetical protein